MIIIHRKGERRQQIQLFAQLNSELKRAKKRKDDLGIELALAAIRKAQKPWFLCTMGR